ncbi:Hypothetical protein, putative [Bodo saltans]|uniref:Uncharacterized protein n=1 Tax=Bodo saltans TaxID=75058 RepID=A0A0S4JE11_BODSA|nr:Hypothetical protein, putative [Bodo saltans]|eukprot:CUG88530.1 Hypothetical protein, putative [Bodo saltans]
MTSIYDEQQSSHGNATTYHEGAFDNGANTAAAAACMVNQAAAEHSPLHEVAMPVPPQPPRQLQQQQVQQHQVTAEVGWKFFTQGLDAKMQGAIEELAAFLSATAHGATSVQTSLKLNNQLADVVAQNEEAQESTEYQESDVSLSAVESELRLALDELRAMRKQQTLDITSNTSIRLMDVAIIAWNRLHGILRQRLPTPVSRPEAAAQQEPQPPTAGSSTLKCVLELRRLICELHLTSIHFFSPFAQSRDNQIVGDPKRALYSATMCLRVAKDALLVINSSSTTSHEQERSGGGMAPEIGTDATEWIQRSFSILNVIGQRVFGCPPLTSLTSRPAPIDNGGNDVLYQRFLDVYRELVRVRFHIACRLPLSMSNARDSHTRNVDCTLPVAGVAALELEMWRLESNSKEPVDATVREVLQIASRCSQVYGEWTATGGLLLDGGAQQHSPSHHRRTIVKELFSSLIDHLLSFDSHVVNGVPCLQQCSATVKEDIQRHILDAVVQLCQLYAMDTEWHLAWSILQKVGTTHACGGWSVPSGPLVGTWMASAFALPNRDSSAVFPNPEMIAVHGEEEDEQRAASALLRIDNLSLVNQVRKELLFRLLSFRAASATSQPNGLQTQLIKKVLEFPIVTAIGCNAARQLFSTASFSTDTKCVKDALAESVALWAQRSADPSCHRTISSHALTSRVIYENTFVLRDCLLRCCNTPPVAFNRTMEELYLQQSSLSSLLLECKGPARMEEDTREFVAHSSRSYLLALWNLGGASPAELPSGGENKTNSDHDATVLLSSPTTTTTLEPHQILILASSFLSFGDADEGSRLWRCIGRNLLQRAEELTGGDKQQELLLLQQAEDAACKSMTFHHSSSRSTSVAAQLLLCDIRLAARDVNGFQASSLQLLQCEPLEDAIDAFHSLISRLASRTREQSPESSWCSTPLLCSVLEQFVRFVLIDSAAAVSFRASSDQVFSMVQAYIVLIVSNERVGRDGSKLPISSEPRDLRLLSRAAAFLTSPQCSSLLDEKLTHPHRMWLVNMLLEAVHDAQGQRSELQSDPTNASHPQQALEINDVHNGICMKLLSTADKLIEATIQNHSSAPQHPQQVLEARELSLRAVLTRMSFAFDVNESHTALGRNGAPYHPFTREDMYSLSQRCMQEWESLYQARSRLHTESNEGNVMQQPSLSSLTGNVPLLISTFQCHLLLWDCVNNGASSLSIKATNECESFRAALAALVVARGSSVRDLESLAASPVLSAQFGDSNATSTNLEHATALLTQRHLSWVTSQALLAKEVCDFLASASSSTSGIFTSLAHCMAKGVSRQDQLSVVFFVLRVLGAVSLTTEQSEIRLVLLLHFAPLRGAPPSTPLLRLHHEDLLSRALRDSDALLRSFDLTCCPLTISCWDPRMVVPPQSFDSTHQRHQTPPDACSWQQLTDSQRSIESIVVELWNQYCGVLWATMAEQDQSMQQQLQRQQQEQQSNSHSNEVQHKSYDAHYVWQRVVLIFTDLLPESSSIRVSIEKQFQ